jgi:UDP-glucose 4-epimerase
MFDRISKAVVTGGAGFIGSHLVDRLLELGISVTVIDNLSTGALTNIRNINSDRLLFVRCDCKENSLEFIRGNDIIFHLAGNPEVRTGSTDTCLDFNENVLSTYKMLESARKYGIGNFVFTSTSTVYGEPLKIPTPESYSPLRPISTYGGSKLACEALVSSFSNMFSINSIIYRLANVVGDRSTHGVVFDFVRKLNMNPRSLEILGDGTQRKSYIDIEDCIEAILFVLDHRESTPFDIYNLGSQDSIDVLSIATIVSNEMGLNPELVITGGVNGGRGWRGDVKIMQLDISKIQTLGWRPKYSSEQAVKRSARALLNRAKETIAVREKSRHDDS